VDRPAFMENDPRSSTSAGSLIFAMFVKRNPKMIII